MGRAWPTGRDAVEGLLSVTPSTTIGNHQRDAAKDVIMSRPDDIPTTPWRPPAPDAIPELRARLAAQMQTPFEISRTAQVVAGGRGSILPPARNPEEAAKRLCAEEHQRLTAAQMYVASAEMSRLAVKAGESLPDFHLEPEDVPALFGFMVFAEPIGSYVDAAVPERFPIVAVSWGQYHGFGHPRGGVWISFYTPNDLLHLERQAAAIAGRSLREHERVRLRALSAPLNWDNEAIFWYGGVDEKASYRPGDSYDANPDKTAPWGQTLRAAWLLMSQDHIAEVQDLQPGRAARRRAEREGVDLHAVRVLHLRRATRSQGAPDGEGPSREYTCRWMVRGHWRQQWYPSRSVHRPIWINPHLKGSEDKPLRTGETVHLWDR
jgi:hypothetical protein